MKKIYILVLAAIVSSSCEDYLDTQPSNKISIEQYYIDEEGLTKALAGVYDPLGSENLYGYRLWETLEGLTDEQSHGRFSLPSGTDGPKANSYDATNVVVSNTWAELYRGINRANDLIAHVDLPKMDEDKRKIILGEALFLRGYYYFLLVSRWGDVPLKLEPTTTPYGTAAARTPSAEVYAQVLKDMTAAEAMVSQTKLQYASRVTKTTVQGILARVCLQMAGYPLMDTSKYADALAWSKKVIDSGQHQLIVAYKTTAPSGKPANYYNTFNPTIAANTANNGYRQIFINEAEDLYDTSEVMWEAEEKGNGVDGFQDYGRLGVLNGVYLSTANATLNSELGNCYGQIKATAKLFRAYDPTGADLRRDWNMTTYTLDNVTGARVAIAPTCQYARDVAKWRREFEVLTPKSKNFGGINFPILRYADVLLMYAEAENQVNGPTAAATEAVNKVRRRGYGQMVVTAPYAPSDAPTATAAAGGKAGFQKFIEEERMRELCFEGVRRADLIRWNKYLQYMKEVGDDYNAMVTNAVNTVPANNNPKMYAPLWLNTAPRYLLFPIPSLEMSSNTLIKPSDQNPGY